MAHEYLTISLSECDVLIQALAHQLAHRELLADDVARMAHALKVELVHAKRSGGKFSLTQAAFFELYRAWLAAIDTFGLEAGDLEKKMMRLYFLPLTREDTVRITIV